MDPSIISRDLSITQGLVGDGDIPAADGGPDNTEAPDPAERAESVGLPLPLFPAGAGQGQAHISVSLLRIPVPAGPRPSPLCRDGKGMMFISSRLC